MSESSNNQSADRPLFVIGRQHSGNTMLATVLDGHPEVYAFTGEGTFFEHWNSMPHDQHIVQRVVREIEGGSDMEEVPGVEELLSRNSPHPLVQFLRQEVGPEASPLELYRRGKQRVTASNGAQRWVQKATSYAFYIKDILQAIPSSRLIFLLRNPLDLTASLKRREGWSHVLRMVWGWNRGTRHVQKWKSDDRVLPVRYEDLVQRPEAVLREVCSFADLPFTERLLDVPHVNRSETPYNTDSDTSGFDDSRVYYFRDVLSPEEEAVARQLVNSDRLQALYPDLPPVREYHRGTQVRLILSMVGGSVGGIVADHAVKAFQNPGHVFDRIRRRI